ncbi:hypothetical protein NEHOM01_0278 [Nematocida homosporus]|uniref:uncharacterized protein n=1 Tax=Nematocida homosporus TaxID=1912981 RepID=UPI00221FB764|nr:uncharacterized protein NEHOM01_0278 [Nematocida homosporus]KAI5184603.1 hypothetical protein NEHOM01_0278 [Nematocida homosporus]
MTSNIANLLFKRIFILVYTCTVWAACFTPPPRHRRQKPTAPFQLVSSDDDISSSEMYFRDKPNTRSTKPQSHVPDYFLSDESLASKRDSFSMDSDSALKTLPINKPLYPPVPTQPTQFRPIVRPKTNRNIRPLTVAQRRVKRSASDPQGIRPIATPTPPDHIQPYWLGANTMNLKPRLQDLAYFSRLFLRIQMLYIKEIRVEGENKCLLPLEKELLIVILAKINADLLHLDRIVMDCQTKTHESKMLFWPLEKRIPLQIRGLMISNCRLKYIYALFAVFSIGQLEKLIIIDSHISSDINLLFPCISWSCLAKEITIINPKKLALLDFSRFHRPQIDHLQLLNLQISPGLLPSFILTGAKIGTIKQLRLTYAVLVHLIKKDGSASLFYNVTLLIITDVTLQVLNQIKRLRPKDLPMLIQSHEQKPVHKLQLRMHPNIKYCQSNGLAEVSKSINKHLIPAPFINICYSKAANRHGRHLVIHLGPNRLPKQLVTTEPIKPTDYAKAKLYHPTPITINIEFIDPTL